MRMSATQVARIIGRKQMQERATKRLKADEQDKEKILIGLEKIDKIIKAITEPRGGGVA